MAGLDLLVPPNTEPCHPPISVVTPLGVVVSWEEGEHVYKIKLYDLDGSVVHGWVDRDSLEDAQAVVDALLD